MNLKNRYFFLRHGKNIHQEELKDILYCWPDDNPPCNLNEEGMKQAEHAGHLLKNKKIEYIFCSDILRTRQTAEIVADIIGFDANKIIYDTRLRDLNWGDFGGKTKEEYWNFYDNERMRCFTLAVPGGESWHQCLERVLRTFNEMESNFEGKNILIVSHGDVMWLLEGYINNIPDEELLERRTEMMLKPGEMKEI